MGTIFAPPYACLAVGYLEIIKMYPMLEINFGHDLVELTKETFDRFMDDGFVAWPKDPNISIFEQFSRVMGPN